MYLNGCVCVYVVRYLQPLYPSRSDQATHAAAIPSPNALDTMCTHLENSLND